MAFFGNNTEKEEKQRQKTQALLEKYNLTDLSNAADIASVQHIATNLAGSGLIDFGSLLSGNEAAMIRVMVQYQRAIMEQNFIMIRQLDRISQSEKMITQLLSKK